MSVINQMLRELDGRMARADGPAPVVAPATGTQPRQRARFLIAAGLALLLMTALAWFALRPVPSITTVAPVSPAPLQADLPKPLILDTRLPDAAGLRPSPPPVQPDNRVTPTRQFALPADSSRAEPAALPQVPDIKKVIEPSPEAEALQLFEAAETARRTGMIDLAKLRYRQALLRNPALEAASLALAALLHDAGEFESALTVLVTAYAQRTQAKLAIAAGRLLAEQGRDAEALTWLGRGQGGLKAADHALQGALHARLQQHGPAINAYQLALKTEPRQGGWLLGLGLSLEANGQPDEARAAFRNAQAYGTFKPEVEKFLQDRILRAEP
jgi:MSHA biogenesis protein MshN